MKMKLHGKVLFILALTCVFLMPANLVFAEPVTTEAETNSFRTPEMAQVAQELGAKYHALKALFNEVGAVDVKKARSLQAEINALQAKLSDLRLEKALEMKAADPNFTLEGEIQKYRENKKRAATAE